MRLGLVQALSHQLGQSSRKFAKGKGLFSTFQCRLAHAKLLGNRFLRADE
jgi:hypothetical protein